MKGGVQLVKIELIKGMIVWVSEMRVWYYENIYDDMNYWGCRVKYSDEIKGEGYCIWVDKMIWLSECVCINEMKS